jgi:hypothetical protein
MYNYLSSIDHHIYDDYYNSKEVLKTHKKEPYIFTVTAVNSAGSGTISDPTADILPNLVPSITNFTVSNSSGTTVGTTVVCNVSLDTGGVNVSSMTLTMFTGTTITGTGTPLTINIGNTSSNNSSGLNYTGLTTTQATNSTIMTNKFNVSGLTVGTSYIFTLTATNSVGTSLSSTSSTISIFSVPGAPTNLSVVPSNGKVIVSFNRPVNNGGATRLTYNAIVRESLDTKKTILKIYFEIWLLLQIQIHQYQFQV